MRDWPRNASDTVVWCTPAASATMRMVTGWDPRRDSLSHRFVGVDDLILESRDWVAVNKLCNSIITSRNALIKVQAISRWIPASSRP
jgi:hypothetical protein